MQFIPKYDAYAQKVHESFTSRSMMQTFGAKISTLSPGHCGISTPILPGARQQNNFAHAALTFAIGDTAAGYAALTLMEEAEEVLTVEMKINLIAPATGDQLIAIGKVIKPGRRLIVVTAEVIAKTKDQCKTVALLQGTMISNRPA
ncbi:MAG: PaaI family thioesterase [Paracoccaceae bacterium]